MKIDWEKFKISGLIGLKYGLKGSVFFAIFPIPFIFGLLVILFFIEGGSFFSYLLALFLLSIMVFLIILIVSIFYISLPAVVAGKILLKISSSLLENDNSSSNKTTKFGCLMGFLFVSVLTIFISNFPHTFLPMFYTYGNYYDSFLSSLGIIATIIAAICGALAGREIHRRNLARLAAGQEEAGE